MSERQGVRRGPTGVGHPGPSLPDDVKEHLRTIAASKAAPSADLDGFVELVDTAASQFWATRSLQEQALPATVRRELKAAHHASRRLIDRLNDLGGTSRHFLYSEGPPENRTRFREALTYVAAQLARARRRSDELSKSGGAPRNHARVCLAALVAHAIQTRLAVKPTTTRGGLFEDVLATVIEAVERRPNPSVSKWMSAGLAAKVSEHPDGVIEINPKVD
jgi:hypothetical protein